MCMYVRGRVVASYYDLESHETPNKTARVSHNSVASQATHVGNANVHIVNH